MRQNISTGAKWEPIVGYSRAVKIGNVIEVSGTAAADGDEIIAEGDMYAQTLYILKKIERVLKEAGATMADVIRTRMFVTDISRWQEAARAHGEFFGIIMPATSMIEVKALIDPRMLIEIEASAVMDDRE
jgi:enamine deaminase RidA (YjgF/YER057c/UK114 family)